MLIDILVSLAGVALLMSLAWVWSLKKKEVDIVDFCWALTIGILSAVYFFRAAQPSLLIQVSTVVILVWSLRLSGYLLFARVLKQGEDGRYQRLRAYWGKDANRKFFWFFQIQGLLVVIIAFQFLLISKVNIPTVPPLIFAGALISIIGIIGETLADYQLNSFVKNPANRGTTCTVGLWKYSRHPNYFFEWLHWCGYPVMLLLSPVFFYALALSFLMLFLVLKVSGIPHTEARAMLSRPDYADYRAKTSFFIPWFPKK
jgi:steroid 5-alpha reductase family enzyme